jgi:hypothetical protein
MNVRRVKLKVGSIYFSVAYEDDEFTRPILHTYEYLGEVKDTKDAPFHFRFIGSDDKLELAERQLDLILDAAGLIKLLARFRDGKPMHSPHAS